MYHRILQSRRSAKEAHVGIVRTQRLITLSVRPRPWFNPRQVFMAHIKNCSITKSVHDPAHNFSKRVTVNKPSAVNLTFCRIELWFQVDASAGHRVQQILHMKSVLQHKNEASYAEHYTNRRSLVRSALINNNHFIFGLLRIWPHSWVGSSYVSSLERTIS